MSLLKTRQHTKRSNFKIYKTQQEQENQQQNCKTCFEQTLHKKNLNCREHSAFRSQAEPKTTTQPNPQN